MNPDTSIKLWLLAAGQQFGINEAHHIRWPDPDTRPQMPYCTYELTDTIPTQDGQQIVKTKTGNTVHRWTMKKHLTTVEVHLYHSRAGLVELAAMAVAAQGEGAIPILLQSQAISFKRNVGVRDETPKNIQGDLTEHYHQVMVCEFGESIGHNMDEANGVVDTINLRIQAGMGDWEIDASGYREQ